MENMFYVSYNYQSSCGTYNTGKTKTFNERYSWNTYDSQSSGYQITWCVVPVVYLVGGAGAI